jgi:hypothetical protein
MHVAPRDIMEMLKTWYSKDNKAMLEEQTFYKVAKEILNGRLQCGTTKLNQIIFCEYNQGL